MNSIFGEEDLDPRNAFSTWALPESVDWDEVRLRVERVATLEGLPHTDVAEAMKNAGPDCDLNELTEFAKKHGQSLDWLVLGDPRRMLSVQRRCRRRNGI